MGYRGVRRIAAALCAAALVLAGATACTVQEPALDPEGRCLPFQLAITVLEHAGPRTTGDYYWDITLTNTSRYACVLGGVPHVSFLAAGSGKPVGVEAVRDDSPSWAVQLAKGNRAYAQLRLHTATKLGCTPVKVDRLSVTVPIPTKMVRTVKTPYVIDGCAGTIAVAEVGRERGKRLP